MVSKKLMLTKMHTNNGFQFLPHPVDNLVDNVENFDRFKVCFQIFRFFTLCLLCITGCITWQKTIRFLCYVTIGIPVKTRLVFPKKVVKNCRAVDSRGPST